MIRPARQPGPAGPPAGATDRKQRERPAASAPARSTALTAASSAILALLPGQHRAGELVRPRSHLEHRLLRPGLPREPGHRRRPAARRIPHRARIRTRTRTHAVTFGGSSTRSVKRSPETDQPLEISPRTDRYDPRTVAPLARASSPMPTGVRWRQCRSRR